jgi:hypothetical protein
MRIDPYSSPATEWANAVHQQAQAEIDDELTRQAIDAVKEKLRERRNRPWWRVLFPWEIKWRGW